MMELRKDPITRSWLLVGDEPEPAPAPSGHCLFCGDGMDPASKMIFSMPLDGSTPAGGRYGSPKPSVRVYPHPRPLYRIEGMENRAAEGIYDRMRAVGAHEVIVESPNHGSQLWIASDQEVERVLRTYAWRITDLKRDGRFKYISVFKNRGALAGEEFEHAHSELAATPFVPRRLLYELRSTREYYTLKERCVFCDIARQEEAKGVRVVEVTANFLAFCPFASRVPYEMWVMPRYHHAAYEADLIERPEALELAGLLRRSLARLLHITDAFHMVLHTIPNTGARLEQPDRWSSILDDYHWHFEILPIVEKRTKSYSIKEVYFNPVSPEFAARRLREAPASVDVAEASLSS